MDPIRTNRLLAYFESGVVTAVEVRNTLLYNLVSESEIDTAFLATVDSLPEEVRDEFFRLLRRIREADFRWTPLLLSSFDEPSDPTLYSVKLRQVCALLGDRV